IRREEVAEAGRLELPGALDPVEVDVGEARTARRAVLAREHEGRTHDRRAVEPDALGHALDASGLARADRAHHHDRAPAAARRAGGRARRGPGPLRAPGSPAQVG